MGDLSQVSDAGGDKLYLQLLSGLDDLEKDKQLNITPELVDNLCRTWIQIKIGLRDKAIVNVDDLFRQLLLYTAYSVLDTKYVSKIEGPIKKNLVDAVEGVEEVLIDYPNLRKVCSSLTSICLAPWEYGAFKDVATNASQVIDTLWESEGVVFLEARLEILGRGKKLKTTSILLMSKILHILLIKGRTQITATGDCDETDKGKFDPYQVKFCNYLEYLEIYILLWSKMKDELETKILTDLCPSVVSRVINMLQEKSSSQTSGRLLSKIWKENTSEILLPLVSLILPHALDRVWDVEGIKSLFVIRFNICIQDHKDVDQQLKELEAILDKLKDVKKGKLMRSDYAYALSEAILEKYDDNEYTRRLYVDTYLGAMNTDMNLIETLRSEVPQDPDKLQNEYLKFSSRFVNLSTYFNGFKITSKELLLTAFSLNPTEYLFNGLFSEDDSSQIMDISEIAPPADSLQAEVPTPSSSSTEKADEAENLNLPKILVDDLLAITQTARWGALRSFTKGDDVKRLCTQLLKAGSDFLVKEKELEYVNPDYEKYAHLPSKYDPNDDGIEKNYYDPNKPRRRPVKRNNTNNGKIRNTTTTFKKLFSRSSAGINNRSWIQKGLHKPVLMGDLRKPMKAGKPIINKIVVQVPPSSPENEKRKALDASNQLLLQLAGIKQFVNFNKHFSEIPDCSQNKSSQYQKKRSVRTNYEKKFCHPHLPMPGSYAWIPDPKPINTPILPTKKSRKPVRKTPTRYIGRRTPFQIIGWPFIDDDFRVEGSKLTQAFIVDDNKSVAKRIEPSCVEDFLPETSESQWMDLEMQRNIEISSGVKLKTKPGGGFCLDMNPKVYMGDSSLHVPEELIQLTREYLTLKSEALSGKYKPQVFQGCNQVGGISKFVLHEKQKYKKVLYRDQTLNGPRFTESWRNKLEICAPLELGDVLEFQFGVVLELDVGSKKIVPPGGPASSRDNFRRKMMIKDALERIKANLLLKSYTWNEVLANARKDDKLKLEAEINPSLIGDITGNRGEKTMLSQPSVFNCPPSRLKSSSGVKFAVPSSGTKITRNDSTDSSSSCPNNSANTRKSFTRRETTRARVEYRTQLEESDSSSDNKRVRGYHYYPDHIIYKAIIAMLRGETMRAAAERHGINRSALCKRLFVMQLRKDGKLVIPPALLRKMNVDETGNSVSLSDSDGIEKRRKNRDYTDEDLNKAIGLVLFTNITHTEASRVTNVPIPTIAHYCGNIRKACADAERENETASESHADRSPTVPLPSPSNINSIITDEKNANILKALTELGKGKRPLTAVAKSHNVNVKDITSVVDAHNSAKLQQKLDNPPYRGRGRRSNPKRNESLNSLDSEVSSTHDDSCLPSSTSQTEGPQEVGNVDSVSQAIPTPAFSHVIENEKPKSAKIFFPALHNPSIRKTAENVSGKPFLVPVTATPTKEILDPSSGKFITVPDNDDTVPKEDEIIKSLPPFTKWQDDDNVMGEEIDGEEEIVDVQKIDVVTPDEKEGKKDEEKAKVADKDCKRLEKEKGKLHVFTLPVNSQPRKMVKPVCEKECKVTLDKNEVEKYFKKHSTPVSSPASPIPSPEMINLSRKSERISNKPTLDFTSGVPTRVPEATSCTINNAGPSKVAAPPFINKRKSEDVHNGNASIVKKRRIGKENENLLPAVVTVNTVVPRPERIPEQWVEKVDVKVKTHFVAKKRTRILSESSTSTPSSSSSNKNVKEVVNRPSTCTKKKVPKKKVMSDSEEETSDEDKNRDPDYCPDEEGYNVPVPKPQKSQKKHSTSSHVITPTFDTYCPGTIEQVAEFVTPRLAPYTPNQIRKPQKHVSQSALRNSDIILIVGNKNNTARPLSKRRVITEDPLRATPTPRSPPVIINISDSEEEINVEHENNDEYQDDSIPETAAIEYQLYNQHPHERYEDFFDITPSNDMALQNLRHPATSSSNDDIIVPDNDSDISNDTNDYVAFEGGPIMDSNVPTCINPAQVYEAESIHPDLATQTIPLSIEDELNDLNAVAVLAASESASSSDRGTTIEPNTISQEDEPIKTGKIRPHSTSSSNTDVSEVSTFSSSSNTSSFAPLGEDCGMELYPNMITESFEESRQLEENQVENHEELDLVVGSQVDNILQPNQVAAVASSSLISPQSSIDESEGQLRFHVEELSGIEEMENDRELLNASTPDGNVRELFNASTPDGNVRELLNASIPDGNVRELLNASTPDGNVEENLNFMEEIRQDSVLAAQSPIRANDSCQSPPQNQAEAVSPPVQMENPTPSEDDGIEAELRNLFESDSEEQTETVPNNLEISQICEDEQAIILERCPSRASGSPPILERMVGFHNFPVRECLDSECEPSPPKLFRYN